MGENILTTEKVYVPVIVIFMEDGTVIPRAIVWEDRVIYEIDKVIDQRRCASLKAGGVGIRFTIMVCGHKRYLYYEENGKWFLEVEKRKR